MAGGESLPHLRDNERRLKRQRCAHILQTICCIIFFGTAYRLCYDAKIKFPTLYPIKGPFDFSVDLMSEVIVAWKLWNYQDVPGSVAASFWAGAGYARRFPPPNVPKDVYSKQDCQPCSHKDEEWFGSSWTPIAPPYQFYP